MNEITKLNPPLKMETNHSNDKQRCLGPYKLSKLLQDCEIQKKALASQVEELKGQLESAQTPEGEKIKELIAMLKAQTEEIHALRQQVKEVEVVLQHAREESDGCLHEAKTVNGMLAKQLSRLMKRLDEERTLKNKFMAVEEKAQKEVQHDILKDAQHEYEKRNEELRKELQKVEAVYKVEKDKNAALLQIERETNASLQEQLTHENRCHAEKVLTDLLLIRKLRIANHHLQEHMEEKNRVLQKDASEREMSFMKELEDLRSQVKLLSTPDLALTASIEAKDKDTQELREETAKLKVEVLEMEAVPDSNYLEPLRDVSVDGEKLPKTTNKRTLWRRFRYSVGLTKN